MIFFTKIEREKNFHGSILLKKITFLLFFGSFFSSFGPKGPKKKKRKNTTNEVRSNLYILLYICARGGARARVRGRAHVRGVCQNRGEGPFFDQFVGVSFSSKKIPSF